MLGSTIQPGSSREINTTRADITLQFILMMAAQTLASMNMERYGKLFQFPVER